MPQAGAALRAPLRGSMGVRTTTLAFDPATLSPDLLLDGDSLTGADGDAVATWTALVGSNATQSTGSDQPIVKASTNGIGGRKVARFVSNDRLAVTLSRARKPVWWTLVMRVTSFADYRTLIAGNLADGGDGALAMDVEQTSGKLRMLKEDRALIGTSTGALTAGQAHVVTATYSAIGEYAFFIDGTAAGSGTNDQTFIAGAVVILGSNFGGGTGLVGDLGYAFSKDVVPTTTQRQNLERELGSRYGITVA